MNTYKKLDTQKNRDPTIRHLKKLGKILVTIILW
jgi:hypothetical protein